MPHLGTKPFVGGTSVAQSLIVMSLLVAIVIPVGVMFAGFTEARVFDCDKAFWSEEVTTPTLPLEFVSATWKEPYVFVVLVLSLFVFGYGLYQKLYAVRLRDLPGLVTWGLLGLTVLSLYGFVAGLGEFAATWAKAQLGGTRNTLIEDNRAAFQDAADAKPALRQEIRRNEGVDALVSQARFRDNEAGLKNRFDTPAVLYSKASHELFYKGCRKTLALEIDIYDPQIGVPIEGSLEVNTYLPLGLRGTDEGRAWGVNWPNVAYLTSALGGAKLWYTWAGYYLILLSPIVLLFICLKAYPTFRAIRFVPSGGDE